MVRHDADGTTMVRCARCGRFRTMWCRWLTNHQALVAVFFVLALVFAIELHRMLSVQTAGVLKMAMHRIIIMILHRFHHEMFTASAILPALLKRGARRTNPANLAARHDGTRAIGCSGPTELPCTWVQIRNGAHHLAVSCPLPSLHATSVTRSRASHSPPMACLGPVSVHPRTNDGSTRICRFFA